MAPRIRIHTALAAVVVTSLAAVACGGCGGGGTPAASPGADAGAHPETFGEVHPDDLAAMGMSADAGAAPAPAPAPAPADTAAAPAKPEKADKPDECTPVGVDFEQRARPKIKECYAEGKKKNPDLKGTVKISVDIDTLGKVRTIKIVEKTLPEPVAQCMLKVVKATPLPDAGKCPGKSLTIPVTFPTPH